MKWTNTGYTTPPQGTYLCIVKTFVETKGETYSITKPHEFVTQCYFDPAKGWRVDMNKLTNWEILFWAVLPELPQI